MIQKWPYLIVFIACVVSFTSTAKESEASPIIQIVTEHLPPFQISSENEVLGFATEIVKAAMKNTPYDFRINLYPWTRSFTMALNKKNTCIYSIAKTLDREQQFIWVSTIAERNASFIGLREKNIEISSIEDAKAYVTAVIRDDVTHQLLLKKGFKERENLYVVNNTHSLLKLLVQRKEIDFILVDAFTIKYRARFNNIDENIFKNFHQLNKKPLDYYLACNVQTSPEVIKNIRLSIDTMKKTNQLKKIIDNWDFPNIKVN
ncbi:substrate-binding periplasmic protein [Colwelliaceae bacterium 6441]